jgi:hypothetical protein
MTTLLPFYAERPLTQPEQVLVAAVELDDKSHERSDRAVTDDKKNMATSAAGVRLVRWNVKALPNEDAIQAIFGPRADGVIHETSGVAPTSAT